MIRGRFVQSQAQEVTHGQRVGCPPGDAALRVEAFEVADQQQAEVPTWGQAGPAHHRRVERAALLLDKPIKPGRIEDRVQPHVERVARGYRQLRRGNPHWCLLALAFAHRHGPQCTILRASGDSISLTFTTGC